MTLTFQARFLESFLSFQQCVSRKDPCLTKRYQKMCSSLSEIILDYTKKALLEIHWFFGTFSRPSSPSRPDKRYGCGEEERSYPILNDFQYLSTTCFHLFSIVSNFFQWFSIVQSVHSLFNIFPTWFANLSVFCFCFAETWDPLGRVAWQHEDAVSAWRFWGQWPYLQIGFIEFQCYTEQSFNMFQNVLWNLRTRATRMNATKVALAWDFKSKSL